MTRRNWDDEAVERQGASLGRLKARHVFSMCKMAKHEYQGHPCHAGLTPDPAPSSQLCSRGAVLGQVNKPHCVIHRQV